MSLSRLCLALALICTITACGKDSPNTTPAPDPKGGPGPTPGSNPKDGQAPVASFTAEDLYKTYNADRKGTDAKYGGKRIEVKGQVRYLAPWTDKKSGEVQLVGNPKKSYDTVSCVTLDPEPWKKVLPGQQATVVGFFSSAGSVPFVKEAQITGVEGTPSASTEVAKLAADLLADAKSVEAAFQKPNDADRIFVGKFRTTGTENGATSWHLEGPKDVKLELTFSPLHAKPPAVPKAGEQIKFVATCRPDGVAREIRFVDCLIVSVTP